MFDVGGVWEKLEGSTTAKVVDRGACGERPVGLKLQLRSPRRKCPKVDYEHSNKLYVIEHCYDL